MNRTQILGKRYAEDYLPDRAISCREGRLDA